MLDMGTLATTFSGAQLAIISLIAYKLFDMDKDLRSGLDRIHALEKRVSHLLGKLGERVND